MKQFLLLLFLNLCIISVSTHATADNTDQYTSTYTGIPVEDAPIIITPPKGYIFFDGEKTRNVLTDYFSNDPSEVTDIVGMLIPDTLSTMQYLGDCAWMLTYDKSGHVNDNHADKMGFNWIIEAYRANSEPGEKFSWAWDPEYNQERHLLVLPFLHTKGNDSEVVLQMKMLGNDGVLDIERFAPSTKTDKVKEEAIAIANGISYTKGNRYENFGLDTYGSSYNSVSSYLKGIAVNNDAVVGSQEEETDPSFLFLPTFIIRGIGITTGILLAAMLIFMTIVAVTNKKDENSKDISRLGFNVLMRICVFAMVYLMLLVLAVFLIWLGIELTVIVFSHVFSVYLVFAAFGIWALIGGFGYAILMSLFHFSKTERHDRLEVSEPDAPNLFRVIRETAETAGEQMPKHVYLSPDANACVFYDKPLLSLFIPGRKNLQLGLVLTEGLNIEELKSILAHEYGHFGQGSMRIGKIVATSYNIAYNIVNAEAFTSHAALTALTRPLLNKVFGYVQRGYLQLSRSMEYEADEACAKSVGADFLISSLCKTDVIMERLNGYNNIVAGIYKTDKLLPSSYWEGWKMYVSLCSKYDGVELKAEVMAEGPLTTEQPSLVKLKDVWTSHPSLRKRIDNIKGITNKSQTNSAEPAYDLVSDEVYNNLSKLYFELTDMPLDTPRDDARYKLLLEKEMGERMFPTALRPYFDRNIMAFDIQELAKDSQKNEIENPLTESNRAKMEEFTRMVSDYQTLMAFKEGSIGEKEIQYDGKVYNRKNVPAEKLLGYLRATEDGIKTIDTDIARLALSKATDREDIVKAYDDIFFSYAVIRHIREQIIPARDQVAANLGSGGEVDNERFKQVQKMLIGLRDGLRQFMASFDVACLEPVLFTDSATHMERLNDDWLCDGISIGGDESAYVLGFPEFIISVFNSLIFFSKKKISDTLEGKPITYFWSGTVAAQKAEQPNKETEK
ncbi:MAG: DUF2167 domain-containing protein [Muribaculaceae bacterium]|nr:DUF2167 domain-containing protein [Muribaculaceae bacterium]